MRIAATLLPLVVLVLLMGVACVRIPVPGNRDITQLGGNLVADYQADPNGNITSVSVVSEMHESFKAFSDMLGRFLDTLTMAYVAGNMLKVQETTKQMENANLTKQQIAQIDAQAQKDAALIGAGVAPPGSTFIPPKPAPVAP